MCTFSIATQINSISIYSSICFAYESGGMSTDFEISRFIKNVIIYPASRFECIEYGHIVAGVFKLWSTTGIEYFYELIQTERRQISGYLGLICMRNICDN